MERPLKLKPDPEDRRDFPVEQVLEAPRGKLPQAISYRGEMTKPKDQKRLGSCTAFATVSCKEWQETLDPERMPIDDLSELDLYRETKRIDPWPGQGTSLRYPLKVLHKLGVTIEKACPYEDKWPIERKTTWWGKGLRRWEKIKSYHRIRNLRQMKQWLTQHGPFVLGVPVGKGFINPTNDAIVQPPGDVLGGHAIAVTGYDDRENLLEFKNSWGQWGDQGYGWMPYKYLEQVDWQDAWGFIPELK